MIELDILDFSSVSIAEFGGLLFGLLYIGCAYYKSNVSWLWGILSGICIIIVDVKETRTVKARNMINQHRREGKNSKDP